MGSKVESRRLMMAAGVPVVPGGKDPLPDLDAAAAAAETIGYPVMLKAAAGGGGKGMRMIPSAAELASSYRAARSRGRRELRRRLGLPGEVHRRTPATSRSR